MSNISPPKYVRRILVTLEARGHKAFLVGGCVRDMLLGARPQDWDVSTSALPEEVMEIFPASRPTGLRHGTVTVTADKRQVEVTTFRADGAYADHRHPDTVSFVGDLTSDLSRRDFTMNAMALAPDGRLMDPFGGASDIEAGLIRCVGEPALRFEEDALRMFRALRFSSRLGFEIEADTQAAMAACSPLAASLAAERVREETEKILLSPRPETVFTLIELGLLDRYLSRRAVRPEGFKRIAALPRKALERWAALCCLLLSEGSVSSAEGFLLSMKLDSRTLRCCVSCTAMLREPKPESRAEWKRLLRRCGVDAVSCAARCRDALYGGSCFKELKSILKSGECFSMKHLAVNGDDLARLGFSGRELGDMLAFLLDYVIEFPGNNRRELLLSLAQGTEE